MSTESQRQGLEMGVFLSLISSRRKELMSRSPNNGRESSEGLTSDCGSEKRRVQAVRVETGRQLGYC